MDVLAVMADGAEGAMVAPAGRDEVVLDLWSEHYGRLAGWCKALVGDEDVAHDVASEAFARLLSRWRGVTDPRGFLYVTALNLIRDGWRSRDRGRRLVERISRQRTVAPDATGWLGDVVRRLPERLRAPIVLHYYADLGLEDVARALGRPEGTVKRQLAEARAQLAQLLQEDDR